MSRGFEQPQAAERYPTLEALAADPRRIDEMVQRCRDIAERLNQGGNGPELVERAEARDCLLLAAERLLGLRTPPHSAAHGTCEREGCHE